MTNVLVMAGPFPPPVHGMSAVNAAVCEAVRNAGAEPTIIDLSASTLSRSLLDRLRRLPKVFRGLTSLAMAPDIKRGVLYLSVSGGWGQVYDLLAVLLAQLREMQITLHHHSFAYLDKPGILTRCLVRCAGANATHVALSPKMAARLRSTYLVANVVPISNAALFVSTGTQPSFRSELRTLGFLSNISVDKGILEFLDLCEAVQIKGLPLRALLAGPFQDEKTEQMTRGRLAALSNVEYVGPQYGVDKETFYASIDALVFPTRYFNEAEPMTLHEATGNGIPVVTYGRGCIPEIIGPDCGCVIDPERPFVPPALKQVEAWLHDPLAFGAASRAAAKRFSQTYADSNSRWQGLLRGLIGEGDLSAVHNTTGLRKL